MLKSKNKWSNKYDKCVKCGTSNNCGISNDKHNGHGLCVKCYNKKYNKENVRRDYKIYIKNIVNWQKENPEKYKKYQRVSVASRRNKDFNFKLKCNISSSICSSLKKNLSSKKGKSTWDFLPYTVDELKQHLENLFEPWMNWSNWGRGKGKWNIDHKIPVSSFNYKNVEDEEFQKCWTLENLRPLGAIENIKKGNKLI